MRNKKDNAVVKRSVMKSNVIMMRSTDDPDPGPFFPSLLQGLSGAHLLGPSRGLDRRGAVSLNLLGNDWHVEEECVIGMEIWRLV